MTDSFSDDEIEAGRKLFAGHIAFVKGVDEVEGETARRFKPLHAGDVTVDRQQANA